MHNAYPFAFSLTESKNETNKTKLQPTNREDEKKTLHQSTEEETTATSNERKKGKKLFLNHLINRNVK